MSNNSNAGGWPRPLGVIGTLAAAVTMAAMGLHFMALATDNRWLHYISKPTPMLGLMLMVWAWTGARCLYPRLIMIGFVFSGIGDVFMMLGDKYFVFGLGSFLVAHLFYVAAFSSGGVPPAPVRIVPFLIFGAAMLTFIWPGVGADLRIPVLCYISVILAMGWRAAARVGLPGESRVLHIFGLAGALSFIVSDSLIAIGKFHAPFAHAHFLIMATYWAGQIGIAYSAAQSVFKGEGVGQLQ